MKKTIIAILASFLLVGSTFAYTPAMEAKISAVQLNDAEQTMYDKLVAIIGPNIDKYGETYRTKVLRILNSVEKKSSGVRMKALVRQISDYTENYANDSALDDLSDLANAIKDNSQSNNETGGSTQQVTTPPVDYDKMSWDAINSDPIVTSYFFSKRPSKLLKIGIVEDDRILTKLDSTYPDLWSWTYKISSSCDLTSVVGKSVLVGTYAENQPYSYYLYAPDGKGAFIKCELTSEKALQNIDWMSRPQDVQWLRANGYDKSIR